MNSKTVPSLILDCKQFVAITMYNSKKTFLTNEELYDSFIKINEIMHKKHNGFVLYSNVYINEMIRDDNSFVDCEKGIYLNKDLNYIEKNILPYISFELLNEVLVEDTNSKEKEL